MEVSRASTKKGRPIAGVVVASVDDQRGLEIVEDELRVRKSENYFMTSVNKFRFARDGLLFSLKLCNFNTERMTSWDIVLRDQMLILAMSCLQSVHPEAIPSFMRGVTEPHLDGLNTFDHLRHALLCITQKDNELANKMIEILSTEENQLGNYLLKRLYFGGWAPGEGEKPEFAVRQWRSLLNPRAFMTNGCGRIALNGFYHMIFLALIMLALMEQKISNFAWHVDVPLATFLTGQIFEEAHEFYISPTYYRSFWNRIDSITTLSLSLYFCLMEFEEVARIALVVCQLFASVRLLGSLRNVEFMHAGLLVRITVAMLNSIVSFLIMYTFLIFAFAFSFFFLFQNSGDPESIGNYTKRPFWFGNTSDSLIETVGLGRSLRGHVHHGDSDHSGNAQDTFGNFWSVALWLFKASLGDFQFQRFKGSQFEGPGTVLLVVYLITCAVILMNFMIAILTETYERHVGQEKLNYFMDVGSNALRKPYHPCVEEPPWMPRPINLLNLVINLTRDGLNWLASALGLLRTRRSIDLAAFHLQIFVYWVSGNLLIAISLVIFQVLVVLPVTILLGMFLSPVSAGCFLVNLFNGEFYNRWRKLEDELDKYAKSKNISMFDKLRRYAKSLTWAQEFVHTGPIIWATFFLSYWLFHVLRFVPGSEVFFDAMSYSESLVVWAVIGKWQSLGSQHMWDRLWCHTFWLIMFVGLLAEIRWLFKPYKFYKESVIIHGWKQVVAQAIANSDGMWDISCLVMPTLSKQQTDEWGATAQAPRSPRNYVPLNRREENTHCPPREVSSDGVFISNINPLTQELRDLCIGGNELEGTNAATVITNNIQRPRLRHQSLTGVNLDDRDTKLLGMQQLEYLVLNASFFLEIITIEPGVRCLLPEMIASIYDEKEPVETHVHDPIGLYISLEDWYWIACSLVWCQRMGKEQFELIPPHVHSPMTSHHRVLLTAHPQLGLYCFAIDGDTTKQGVFFEDYFWAVWDGSAHKRHIQCADLLEHVAVCARQLVELVEKEEVQLLEYIEENERNKLSLFAREQPESPLFADKESYTIPNKEAKCAL